MLELKPITEENFLDAFQLQLAPGQEQFVSHPIRSLAQAYVYREQCQPFGIYADGKMVGYVMVIYDYDVPEYDIWHMMIDASAQGRGYGSEALDRVECRSVTGRGAAEELVWVRPEELRGIPFVPESVGERLLGLPETMEHLIEINSR